MILRTVLDFRSAALHGILLAFYWQKLLKKRRQYGFVFKTQFFYDSRKTDLTTEQCCLSLDIKVKPALKTFHLEAATNSNKKVFHFLHI